MDVCCSGSMSKMLLSLICLIHCIVKCRSGSVFTICNSDQLWKANTQWFIHCVHSKGKKSRELIDTDLTIYSIWSYVSVDLMPNFHSLLSSMFGLHHFNRALDCILQPKFATSEPVSAFCFFYTSSGRGESKNLESELREREGRRLFQARKDKVSLSANNGKTNSTIPRDACALRGTLV